MPYYMDRHDLAGVTPAEVAAAHLQDLDVQERFAVRFLSYWFDYERQAAFCLVDSPSEEQAVAVHAASHGLTPNQIIPVDRGTVEMFLGHVLDPAESGVVTSAFRVVMFTDMVSSTSLTQRLGDGAAMVVLRQHNAIVRAALEGYRGSEVKHTGDGIMAAFALVTDALGCAVAIQRTIATHNASAEPDRRFEVRIGMAAGEPVTEDDDLFGAAVQLAARLCGTARPNEICVAETLRGLAIGKRFAFTPMASIELKGFDDPVGVMRLDWEQDDATTQLSPATPPAPE